MVSYDLSYVFKFLPEILYALPLTLWILIVTIVIGSLLGALLAWGQLYGDEVIIKGWEKKYFFFHQFVKLAKQKLCLKELIEE